MNRDENEPENRPPAGTEVPAVHSWVDPTGRVHPTAAVTTAEDGSWTVRVHRETETMLRVDIDAVHTRTGGSADPTGTGTSQP